MSANHIQLRRDDHVATIALCNPQRHNALGAGEVARFISHLETVADDPDIRVLIITNPEGKTFCAGAALNELTTGALTSNQFATLPDRISAMKIPTIAALRGNAFGGGCEIALSCDFRIGTSHMKLHVPPARLGLCYPVNGIHRFVTLLGISTAKRLLLANEEFSGNQLLELGFLTHLVDRSDISEAAAKLARTIAAFGPIAVSTMKAICNDVAAGNFDREKALQAEFRCNASSDLKEGLAAVVEKRQPVFRGR